MNHVDDAMNENDIIKQLVPKVEDKVYTTIKKIENTDEWKKVKFIIFYGSSAKNEARDASDHDICIYFDGKGNEEMSRFRLKVLSEFFDDSYDVKIFQQLPLYVKAEVLKGIVIFCRDEQFLYDVALKTIREFDDFKHRYYDYIGYRMIT